MASARTDDVARLATLDRTPAACGGCRHGGLRPFAAASAPLRPAFGAPSRLGSAAFQTTQDGEPPKSTAMATTALASPGHPHKSRAHEENTLPEKHGGADSTNESDAARAPESSYASAAPRNRYALPRSSLSSSPSQVHSTYLDEQSAEPTAAEPLLRTSDAPGMEEQHVPDYTPSSQSPFDAFSKRTDPGSLPAMPAPGATPPGPVARGSIQRKSSRPDAVVFGHDCPKGRPVESSVTVPNTTPKRPREMPNIDEITSLLSKCRAEDDPDDVQRATELLASLHVPGKRPRTHERHPTPSVYPGDASAVSDGNAPSPSEEDTGNHQPSAPDHWQDDDDELSFLVTNCDIDDGTRSKLFMPYIL